MIIYSIILSICNPIGNAQHIDCHIVTISQCLISQTVCAPIE